MLPGVGPDPLNTTSVLFSIDFGDSFFNGCVKAKVIKERMKKSAYILE